jgi:hypothetical protein
VYHTDWHKYKECAAAIKYLELLKKQVRKTTMCSYQKTGHTDAEVAELVWRIQSVAESHKLLQDIPHRIENENAAKFPDLLAKGEQKFESTVLKTFNTRLKEWKEGIPSEVVIDELPPVQLEESINE